MASGSLRQGPSERTIPNGRATAALLILFVISTCAFTYEFAVSAQHGYLVGDSTRHLIVNMAIMIVAMGIGQFCSRWVNWQEVAIVRNELLVALVGGNANLALYAVWVHLPEAAGSLGLLYAFVLGVLNGLQGPLFLRLVNSAGLSLREASAWVSLPDFLSVIPACGIYLWLLRGPGMVMGSYLVGMLNVATACMALFVFQEQIQGRARKGLLALAAGVLVILFAGYTWGDLAVTGLEQRFYTGRIIHRQQTPFQRIILTEQRGRIHLFLNGNLQFAEADEHRYHEALVHIPMAAAGTVERILILGGGDGLAAREVLKWPQVKRIDLVEIDPAVTTLAAHHPQLRRINGGSLQDPRLTVIHADAFKWLETATESYDTILVDLPDPNNINLAKLYTREFYAMAAARLAPHGIMAVQSTSPYAAREAFWMVVRTVAAAGLDVLPYHLYVPSFGDWGFTLAGRRPLSPAAIGPLPPEVATRYLTPATTAALFVFPPDTADQGRAISTLMRPLIVEAYARGWQEWQSDGG